MQKHSSLLYWSIDDEEKKFCDTAITIFWEYKPCRNTLAYCAGASMMKKKVL
jgi:hypothetical protein